MEPSIRTIKDRMNEKITQTEASNNIDYGKCGKRIIRKGHQSKNLEAERKRRKKLNDRLYSLRALVPNISKLNRGAILGDAINYVKDLQKQVTDLQIELEEDSNSDDDDENAMIIARLINSNISGDDHNNIQNDVPGPKNGISFLTSDFHSESFGNNYGGMIKAPKKQNNQVENTNETVQQMEPQVEVFQIDGNELFVKVFCEHKAGGFVRLLETLNSLGFQVNNVNATRHTCLVSIIFRLELKRDISETFHTDHVRESLLELARNPMRWP